MPPESESESESESEFESESESEPMCAVATPFSTRVCSSYM